MAKLITKFKYLKPHLHENIGGYAKYIATREGVEKIDESFKLAPATEKQKKLIEKILKDFPDAKEMLEYEDFQANQTIGNASEFISRAVEDNAYEAMNRKTYADYIAIRPRAERFSTHGLFTDDGVLVQLPKVSEQLNLHTGNVWTIILSLRREDAERLGFGQGTRWRDMLRSQADIIARNFKIPIENLHWYASFHNESHHPHAHVIVYSSVENEGYLTKKGVNNLRSSFANSIFAQEMECIYEKRKEHRDELRSHSRELVAQIVASINAGTYDNPTVENKLLELADRLSKTKGKKQYGYLKDDLKAMVNTIVMELSKDERIAGLYDLWYQKQEELIQVYTQELPPRMELVDNPEFKTVKNVVIQEALNIMADRITVEEVDDASLVPEETEEPVDPPAASDTDTEDPATERDRSWWTAEYKWARAYLYGNASTAVDLEQAFQLMEKEAKRGNGFAMFDFGKMHMAGLGCEKDETIAERWYASALRAFLAEEPHAKRPAYLQYRIGKMYALGCGTEKDYSEAAQWYEKAVADGNPFAAYSLASLYRRGEGVERNDKKAYSLYEMAAEDKSKPNAYAAYELGRMCYDGIGTEVDRDMADYWYSAAYDGFLAIERNQADDKLYYRLGQMNLTGTGTRADPDMALHYFQKAAKLENVDALYGLGKLYLDKSFHQYDPNKAVEYLIDAGKKDHDFAQYTLGRLFLKGIEVRKDVDYAIRWLEEAVKNENSYAEYLLGRILLLGEEVERDPKRGEALLRKSAESGNDTARYMLGKALIEGRFVMQNTPEGVKFITEAAENNFSAAQYFLGKLLYEGKSTPQDLKKSLHYLERAAARENTYAAYLAGKILLTEESVKDPARAIRNFELAAQIGNDFAEYQLGKIYLYGKDAPQDYEKAMAYLTAASAHGNQYAKQLLHSIETNRNWSVATGSLRLLHHMSRMLKNQLEEDQRVMDAVATDRKIRQKEEEKKQLHGQKHG